MDFDSAAYKRWTSNDPTGAAYFSSLLSLQQNPWNANKNEVCTVQKEVNLVGTPNVYANLCNEIASTDNVFLSSSLGATAAFSDFAQSLTISAFGATIEVADPDGVRTDNHFTIEVSTKDTDGVETFSDTVDFEVGTPHFIGFCDEASSIASISFTVLGPAVICFDDLYIQY
ncbi:MAG: hypothetical protein SGILL_001642 [Bacillariaceae sp.]